MLLNLKSDGYPDYPKTQTQILVGPGELGHQSVTNHLNELRSACLSIEVRQMERIKLTLLPNNLLELCSFCVVTVIATHIHNLCLGFGFVFFFFFSRQKATEQLILVVVVFTPS